MKTTVVQAEKIVLSETIDFGTELVSLDAALNRVLAENIIADRDLPPYNRVAMDGIAISYTAFEKGIATFRIAGTQAAGDTPIDISNEDECIEIMTGAALPASTDTIVRYEDIKVENGIVTILIDDIRKGQNIHKKAIDKKQGDVIAAANQIIHPALISIAASVGKTEILVKKLPKVVIITTGNELVNIVDTPSPYEIRKSNNYAIKATLLQYDLNADMLHIADDLAITKQSLRKCLAQYDVIILSGGISAGKFDYVPQVLEELAVKKLFHKVEQRPGKHFWFGKHDACVMVFAFPGNPVSSFMCLHRYFMPWLQKCIGITTTMTYAILESDINFKPQLQYFLQVKLGFNNSGQIIAMPIEGNGSGDFANLQDADAFMELPAERDNFNKGEVYRIWPYKRIL
jgi:molybdopterin molybdotransferase